MGSAHSRDRPARLEAAPLRALLNNADPLQAALVGYLLATVNDSAGLDHLVRYWREQAAEDPAIRRLVYRAVAASAMTPARRCSKRSTARSLPTRLGPQYYWTIRSMSGPDVGLKLRKKNPRRAWHGSA